MGVTFAGPGLKRVLQLTVALGTATAFCAALGYVVGLVLRGWWCQ